MCARHNRPVSYPYLIHREYGSTTEPVLHAAPLQDVMSSTSSLYYLCLAFMVTRYWRYNHGQPELDAKV
jgi:hypothetical protein